MNPETQRRFDVFCRLFYREKRIRAAFELLVAETYIQHSPGIGQGREAAIQALEPLFGREDFTVTPVRTLWDGNLVTVVLDAQVGATVRALVVDLYRFDGDHIVEHWDVKLEIEAGRREGFFDGLRPVSA
ncbi:MAG: hypothetical protein RLZZ200_1026 [Pseudomonadota bacterium]|jgi:predicted SnoaL-like aldol condensation-catalyzing enzyme